MSDIKIENGCRTPEVIAQELRKYGKRIGVYLDDEYYSFEDTTYRIISVNGTVVQVMKVNVSEAFKTIIACSRLEYGNF